MRIKFGDATCSVDRAPALMVRGVTIEGEKRLLPERVMTIANPTGEIAFTRHIVDSGFDWRSQLTALLGEWLPGSHRKLLARVTRSKRRYR